MPFLDGVRALAVTMVFIFHLNPNWISGGFIGVDIFFVISGFLITQIIWKSLSNTTFQYGQFLWSRCKRLIPAYGFVIAVITVFAAFILLPNELLEYNKSLAYSIPFLTNWWFFIKSGYFESSSEYFPLLHTWSLAVEWQFYLVFPLFLLLIFKLKKEYIVSSLVVFTFITAIVSIILTSIDPSMAFYLSPFRAAEFLIGGLVSFLVTKSVKISQRMINLMVNISFLGILIYGFGLTKDSVFPGFYAIIVAILTGMFIFGLYKQEQSAVKVLLSSKPVVFVGKISYSFYLWHWPIILFSKFYFDSIDNFAIYAFIILTTLSCTLFSYFLIENQFRKTQKTTKNVVSFLIAYCVILAIPIYAIKSTDGLSYRLAEKEKEVLNIARWRDFPGKCEYTQEHDRFYGCKIGELTSPPQVLLWGDSHAQILIWKYDELAKKMNKSVLSYTKGGCPPLLDGVLRQTNIEKDICLSMQQHVIDYLNQNQSITEVILVGRWNGYKNRELSTRTEDLSPNTLEEKLHETIDFLVAKGLKVHFIDTIPQPGFMVPETWVRKRLLDKAVHNYFFQDKSSEVSQRWLSQLDKNQVKVYHPANYLCNLEKCLWFLNGNPLYFDADHLSSYGVDIIEPILHSTLKHKLSLADINLKATNKP